MAEAEILRNSANCDHISEHESLPSPTICSAVKPASDPEPTVSDLQASQCAGEIGAAQSSHGGKEKVWVWLVKVLWLQCCQFLY